MWEGSMRDVLRFFGVLSGVGGAVVAAALVAGPLVAGETLDFATGLVALAWFLGGVFWAALCVTVADVHAEVARLRAELRSSSPRRA